MATDAYPDNKAQGANMGPTWVLSAPDGPHVGPMNLAIRVALYCSSSAATTLSIKDSLVVLLFENKLWLSALEAC